MTHADTLFLRLENVCKSVLAHNKERLILNNVSYTFTRGNYYAITGISGSGKTTLLYLLGGVSLPSRGTISVNGSDFLLTMNKEAQQHYRQQTIGMMFQFHYLLNELSVLDNVMLPTLVTGTCRKTAEQEALKLLEMVGLTALKDANPANLSGGEKQRVALARALINKPAFLLADEPTASLDHDSSLMIKNLMLECTRTMNMGVIVATHDPLMYADAQHRLDLSEK